MTGRDVVGIAQTGTGKTAAFALPILHRILENRIKPQPKTCRVLVLSPTRELSGQILDSFNAYGRHLRLSSALAIGGVPMGRQVRSVMQGVDVMVATPGRLLDLVQSNGVDPPVFSGAAFVLFCRLMAFLAISPVTWVVQRSGRGRRGDSDLGGRRAVAALRLAKPHLKTEDSSFTRTFGTIPGRRRGGGSQSPTLQGQPVLFLVQRGHAGSEKEQATFSISSIPPEKPFLSKMRRDGGVWEAYLVAPKTGLYRRTWPLVVDPTDVVVALLYAYK